MSHNRLMTLLLAASMFFTGASGLINEYVLSTVSTYILGNSIEQFSITIAVMLGMMGVGSSFQKKIDDVQILWAFIGVETLLALIGSYAPIGIYAAFGYANDNFVFVYYVLVASIGFLIGFEIPLIIRINERYAGTLKANLSAVMAADYIGSFVGALVWVYLLLPYFNLNQISFIVSGINFLVAAGTVALFVQTRILRFTAMPIFAFLLIGALLLYGYLNVYKWEVTLEQRLYSDRIEESVTTKYQHLTLTKNSNLNETRFYINGNVQFSSLDEKRYHEFMVHSVMGIARSHKSVLVLGGGDGLALRELKKYKDITRITLVDLDPGMVRFAKTNPTMRKLNDGAFDDARVDVIDYDPMGTDFESIMARDDRNVTMKLADVQVINVDADLFLQRLGERAFDAVIVDFPDPSSVELNKLYTKQFYMKLLQHCHKDTVVIVQSTSPYHAKESFLCIGRTMAAVGFNVVPAHLNIPAFGDWGWWIASKTPKEVLKKELQTLKRINVQTAFLTPEVVSAALVFGKESLKTTDRSINTLMKPTLLDIYIKNSWLTY